ncbi:hypothetical protein BGZ61DRAFT_136852 [Ilyonectria robusta]|uniref:uncharacterized protein n=1 Tax=Ilyonectria robusta TaxID=1079257 RepID=UPI001E8ED64D|nr:uncharacterized protein BGZ61DRAFT_136852 [Ilyonectria robusta]KAH8735200.1 hypothetical protein BGZ61DRAFT_136852 [Ilyonectria robusta]
MLVLGTGRELGLGSRTGNRISDWRTALFVQQGKITYLFIVSLFSMPLMLLVSHNRTQMSHGPFMKCIKVQYVCITRQISIHDACHQPLGRKHLFTNLWTKPRHPIPLFAPTPPGWVNAKNPICSLDSLRSTSQSRLKQVKKRTKRGGRMILKPMLPWSNIYRGKCPHGLYPDSRSNYP